MPIDRRLTRSALAFGLGLPLLALSHGAVAQDVVATTPMTPGDIESLPAEYRTGPVPAAETTERTVGPDGVETITRTRRIESTAPAGYEQAYAVDAERQAGAQAYTQSYVRAAQAAPAPVVFERERWLEECRRRTAGRDDSEKGGIIGALLGAITGGIIGNRIADGERLGGTLIGAGTGGLAGLLLGNLIGSGRDDDGYDCEAALDSYISQYGYPATGPARVASRSIPANAPVYAQPAYAAPAYAQAPYGYAAYPAYQGYSYAPPPQMVMVPVRYEQPQRVIVRETVREEMVPAERSIPAAAPPAPAPVPAPTKVRPVAPPSPKLIKQR